MRGKSEREWILNEEDLLFKFKNWIKANQAKLEVVLVWNYVNQELLAGENAATVEHFREDNKLNLPVSLSCVHSWMLRVGCSYDRVASHLEHNLLRSISTYRIWKFARRARDYMRAYADPTKPASFLLIEKMCKKVKTHRCVQDQDFLFIVSAP